MNSVILTTAPAHLAKVVKIIKQQLPWLYLLVILGCETTKSPATPGATQLSAYLPLLRGKKVALVVNATSCIRDKHIVDVLLRRGIAIRKIFAPEHGFRGDKGPWEAFDDSVDPVTHLPIISLHGKVKEPTQAMLDDVDIILFDIQDVGVRCYTYLSTLHNVMQACAIHQVPLVVLDRPNPNGHYVDGPVLDPAFQSFVGKHPIPLVHGLTLGELAQMINGEGWLQSAQQCDLTVIPVANYTHQTPYSPPIPPSPNLGNDQAIALYPTLVLFEGTTISTARGTTFPFQAIGYPDEAFGTFQFTPVSVPNKAPNPKHKGQPCHGIDLREAPKPQHLDLQYLLRFYQMAKAKSLPFFATMFDAHAGSDQLRKQLEAGCSEAEIRASWQQRLDDYNARRKQYLLYD